MKNMKIFVAGQEIASVPVIPSDDPPAMMYTPVANVRIEADCICFDTHFGEFTGIGYDEAAFKMLKEAEESGEFLRINYTTK